MRDRRAGAGVEDVQVLRVDAIEARLPGYPLDATRETLRLHGNMSSPSVLCALEKCLANFNGDRALWLTSFGAGFAAHACELVRE